MEFLVKEIVQPVARRAGTAVGAWLVAAGVSGDAVNVIVAGVTAAILVAVDLVFSYKSRK